MLREYSGVGSLLADYLEGNEIERRQKNEKGIKRGGRYEDSDVNNMVSSYNSGKWE